jgi:hypothetical protein
MKRSNWRGSALLFAAGALAGIAILVEAGRTAAEAGAATTVQAPAATQAPEAPTPTSNEISDFPQLD